MEKVAELDAIDRSARTAARRAGHSHAIAVGHAVRADGRKLCGCGAPTSAEHVLLRCPDRPAWWREHAAGKKLWHFLVDDPVPTLQYLDERGDLRLPLAELLCRPCGQDVSAR